MKLYYHPASTTSRMVMLFAAENKVPLEMQVVDLMTGEHLKEAYRGINPNALVPVLEDGDFRLTESSAILKYLADKIDSPTYPKDLKKRARVNEMMDWLNANIYKDFGYGLVYPQIFAHHKRPGDDLQSGTLGWHKAKSQSWLEILDKHLIGPKKRFLCGDEVTIADYCGAPMMTLGEIVGCDFARYPNVSRWLGNMKALPTWGKVNEVFNGFVAAMKGKAFEKV